MEQLLAIGCPPLTDGCFYRLKYDGVALYELQIRQERKRFGSRYIDSVHIFSGRKVWNDENESEWHWAEWESAEQAIKARAEVLVEQIKDTQVSRTWHQQMHDLLGDHK